LEKRQGLRTNKRRRSNRGASEFTEQPNTWGIRGGKLEVLSNQNLIEIHNASIKILTKVGFSEYCDKVAETIKASGGTINKNNRICFSEQTINEALSKLQKDINLFGQGGTYKIDMSKSKVHFGTGGATPTVRDLYTEEFRDSTLLDLYDFARLTDKLENIHFFSRPVVARDMPNNQLLDLNTAFACLTGTKKHVIVSASSVESVKQISKLCFIIAGSKSNFVNKPFLSIHINHVVPPLRFSTEATDVLYECANLGIPVMINTFGQLGASSPVTIAGCLAQTNAETLAGMVLAWLINPSIKAIYGARPMITDLRTGGMAGGSGEQALLTAGAVQLANFYGFSNSTIAGATDSKSADAQSGLEKSLNITLAAQSGANLITQAAGTQAGLMVSSFTACVIDDDMIGTIARSLANIPVNVETLSLDLIESTVNNDGHFLGATDTFSRMKSDFLYPKISDRTTFDEWNMAGRVEIGQKATTRAKEILNDYFPNHIKPDFITEIRNNFEIKIETHKMRPQ
jgi:trimethylamine--corrinoid protein Co-methyltransferase